MQKQKQKKQKSHQLVLEQSPLLKSIAKMKSKSTI